MNSTKKYRNPYSSSQRRTMAEQGISSFSIFAASLIIIVGAFASLPTTVQPIGVAYGVHGSNLPSRRDVVHLYRARGITGMRIYFPDKQVLGALRNSGIGLVLDVGGDNVARLAASAANAVSWVKANVRPYYPYVDIKYIAVGNEVTGSASHRLLPAMRNLRAALSAAGLGGIKVSTAVRFDAMTDTFPPSRGAFRDRSVMVPVAQFLATTGAPLLVNVYPYFAYRDNPRDVDVNYATFQAGTTVRDAGSGLSYTNLFDAMVDAVYASLEKAGTPGVRVVVAESGWPSDGGFGATPENARRYNQGLINHVGGGTPKKPRRPLETYIFAMFNENEKGGQQTEKHFGLFNADMSPAYAIRFH